jgi:VWFA-related protein
MLRPLLVLVCTAAAAAVASAQQIGQNTQPGATSGGPATFSTSTQLVIETVAVLDKSGAPVSGLTARDFSVTEDGVPQAIKVFEHQKLPDSPPPLAPAPGHARIYEKLKRTQIAPEAAAPGRYKDRRLLALYFDMTSMQTADQLRALAAARQFVRTQMSAADLMAIFRYSGGAVDVLQDFTDDRNRLLSIIQTLIVGEGQGYGELPSNAAASDAGAAFGQDDSEFNVFNTDRQLSALQTAANMLSRLNQKKVLVYFAAGLRLNGLNNQAQLRATINSAIRAGVSFWPIDARGLVADAPMGDAATGSPGTVAMYSGAGAMAMMNSFQQSQDTLYALAADTGGKALFDDNNLTRGVVNAARSIGEYYIIGYYTTNAALDGKFRRIRITLNRELAATLDYRQGYFAGKDFSKFTLADKERQLEDALMLPDPITELTIAMEIDYFQLNRAEYFVPIAVKIPGRELALAKRAGAERTVIDFIGEIKNSFGTTVSNVRDKVSARLSGETAAELARRPIIYDTGFTLLPGRYTIKFLARDAETGRIGTFQTNFVIPNLNKEEKRIPLSSVVLASQRVALDEAIYNAAKSKSREETLNPLVHNRLKLIPSVTRVFRTGQTLSVYLEAYGQTAQPVQPLVAAVVLHDGRETVLESPAIEVSESTNTRLGTMPLQFEIPLQRLPPGRYDCQITVLSPAGNRAAFWQAPVLIVN